MQSQLTMKNVTYEDVYAKCGKCGGCSYSKDGKTINNPCYCNMKKILFVYDLADETNWKDGLWAAVKLLEKDYDVYMENLSVQHSMIVEDGWDFILGWGGFGSSVDKEIRKPIYSKDKKGLCLAGYGFPATNANYYDVLFYECDWARNWLLEQGIERGTELIHAFGVNTDIYKPDPNAIKIWDFITVGTFSNWKRQTDLLRLEGHKIAVGAIQKDNLGESVNIIGELILGGCAVSGEVSPETLAKLYNASKECYIPAEVIGGGERALLEARACGVNVGIKTDNPKLKELTLSPLWDHKYYAAQLKKGIEACIK